MKKKELGASMIEYAILVAIIAVAAIAGVTSFGDKIKTAFISVGTKVENAAK
jgi:pilus assembly protein Flp/PilA